MHPISFVFDIGTGLNLIRFDVLDRCRRDSTFQHEMLDIGSASDTKLKVSGIFTITLRVVKQSTRVTIGVVKELFVPVFLRTAFFDRFIKSSLAARRKIVLHHSPSVPMFMSHEVWSVGPTVTFRRHISAPYSSHLKYLFSTYFPYFLLASHPGECHM